jgi:hypothetical protein
MNEYPEVLPATKMIGKQIVNRAGEELGVLKEWIISFGGLLGLGNKFFAIPWEALMRMMTGRTFMVDIASRLKNAS